MSPLLLPLTTPDEPVTEYRKERAAFAQMQAELHARKPRKPWLAWKSWIRVPFARRSVLR